MATTSTTMPATTQTKRAKQEKGRGTLMATRAKLTSADTARDEPDPMQLSPPLMLKPLTMVPAAPQTAGEENPNGAQSFRSRSSYQG